ncbi:acyltransferase family protein [Microbulbifer sp. 2304DJ12-6]|uniref:acyltransferase family protein n=1 Tax=Microbulbifer sp. 2304DJ12-6 TaxID=3233340 RepID=UPI0039AF0022
MNNNRISELDWLRVGLILAVFLHHVLMPFNGDGWHIMNSESSKLLDDIMVYFEQYRLPALFFIAGAGSVLLLRRISALQFLREKFFRLFIPLMVGMLFIVPPQNFIENIGDYESYWQAFPTLALKFDSNHLWFIEYLIVFALFAIPLHIFLKSKPAMLIKSGLERLSFIPSGLFFLVAMLIAIRVGLKIYFPGNDQTISNPASSLFYLFFFVSGMAFIQSQVVWQSISKNRRANMMWLIVSSLIFYGYYYSPDLSGYLPLQTRWSLWWFVCCLVAWSALLTLIGYAQHYLKHTPEWLKLSNELIYPFYIFHQTVIVVIGYYVISWPISLGYKALILLVSSLLVTTSICLLAVYPFNMSRRLFGLKPAKVSVSDDMAYNKALHRTGR